MHVAARWGLAAAAALLPAHLGAVQAGQEGAAGRSWTAALWAQGAYQVTSGRLATAPSNLIEEPLANMVADLGRAFVVGGGVDIGFPALDLDLRLGIETSMGAEATGQVGVCTLFDGPLGGPLCRVEAAPVEVRGITAQLRIYRGNPAWRVRPLFGGGAGWRQYSFERPDCSGRASGGPQRACNLITDMFHGPGGHVVFRVAAGARAKSGRYMSDLIASAGTGRFAGGTPRVNGNWYMDVRIELSAGIQIL